MDDEVKNYCAQFALIPKAFCSTLKRHVIMKILIYKTKNPSKWQINKSWAKTIASWRVRQYQIPVYSLLECKWFSLTELAGGDWGKNMGL